jgi:hypothetical protein
MCPAARYTLHNVRSCDLPLGHPGDHIGTSWTDPTPRPFTPAWVGCFGNVIERRRPA